MCCALDDQNLLLSRFDTKMPETGLIEILHPLGGEYDAHVTTWVIDLENRRRTDVGLPPTAHFTSEVKDTVSETFYQKPPNKRGLPNLA